MFAPKIPLGKVALGPRQFSRQLDKVFIRNEFLFKTNLNLAPKIGPKIVSVQNGSGSCVEVEWVLPPESTDQTIVGYRIMVSVMAKN